MVSVHFARVLVLALVLVCLALYAYVSHRQAQVANYPGSLYAPSSGPALAPATQTHGADSAFVGGMKSLWDNLRYGAAPPSTSQSAAAPQQSAAAEDAVPGAYAPKMSNNTAREELGRATWKFLHTLTLRFPEHPTAQQSHDFKEFFRLFSLLYPCGDCAAHFQALLQEMPPQAASRRNAALWLCGAHNKVNARLGKPQFDCDKLDSAYDCGCAPSKPADSDAAAADALESVQPADASGTAHVL